MNVLLARLRELARASVQSDPSPTLLSEIVDTAAIEFLDHTITLHAPDNVRLPLSKDQGQIALHHLLQNAFQNGATSVDITYDPASRSFDCGG